MADETKVYRLVFESNGKTYSQEVSGAVADVIRSLKSLESAESSLTRVRIVESDKRKKSIKDEADVAANSNKSQLAGVASASAIFPPATERSITGFSARFTNQLKAAEDRINPFSKAIRQAEDDVARFQTVIDKMRLDGIAEGSDEAIRAVNNLVQAQQRLVDIQDKSALSAGLANDNLSALDAAARSLRGQIDPLSVAERNYGQATAIADTLLAKHKINVREYGEAIRLARFGFEETAASIRREAETALRDLTVASDRLRSASALGRPVGSAAPTATTSTLASVNTVTTQLRENVVTGKPADPATMESIRLLTMETNKLAAAEEVAAANAQRIKDSLDPVGAIARKLSADIAVLDENLGRLSPEQIDKVKQSLTAAAQVKSADISGRTAAMDDYERLAKSAQDYREKLNPLLQAQRQYSAAIKETSEFASVGLIPQKQATLVIDDYTKKLATVDENLKKADAAQLNTQQITKQFRPTLQQASRDFENFNSTTTRSFGLNRIGLLQLQAAGVNAFQSLAAGISPFRTAVTEGAQVVGAFIQGTNLGFKQFIAYAAPIAAVGTALLVTAGAIAAAAARAQTIRELNVALQQFHSSTSLTGKDLEDVAKSFRATGESSSQLNTILAEIARNPTLNPNFAKPLIATARDIGAAFGTDLPDGFKRLSTALDGGTKGIIDLGVSLGVLTPKQVAEILTLERTVSSQAAVKRGYDDIVARLKPYTDTLSPIARLNREIASTWNIFLDALEKSGPIQSALGLINKLTDSLSKLNKETEKGTNPSETSTRLSNAMSGATGGAAAGAVAGGIAASPGIITTPFGIAAGAVGGAIVGGALGYNVTPTPNTSVTAKVPAVVATGTGGTVAAVDDLLRMEHKRPSDADLKNYLLNGGVGLDPTTSAWCAAIVNAALQQHGVAGSGSNIANSFLNFGTAVEPSQVRKGDIVDISHGAGVGEVGGHVALATGATRTGANNVLEIEVVGRSGIGTDEIRPRWRSVNEGLSIRRVPQTAAATAAATGGPTTEETTTQTKAIGEANAELTKRQDILQKQIPVLETYGAIQQAGTAGLNAYNEVFDKTNDVASASAAGLQAYNESITKSRIELQKQVDTQKLTNDLGLETARITSQDEVQGLQSSANAAATLANKQEPLINIQQKYNELIATGAVEAINAGAKAIPALVQQTQASERLANATAKGASEAHQADLENQAVAASHNALAAAIATGNKELIVEAQNLETTNLLLIRRNDIEKQTAEVNKTIQTNREQIDIIRLQLSLQGQTTEEIAKQTAILQVNQKIQGEFSQLSDKTKQAWMDSTIQLQNYNEALVRAQREQERINSLITDIANNISSSLTSAIDDAFDQKKAIDWGEKLKSVLKDVVRSLSEQLVIKPLLGSLAGGLGFGQVAQSLGTVAGIGSAGTGIGGNAATGAVGLPTGTGSIGQALGLANNVGGGGLNLGGGIGNLGGIGNFINENIGSALGFATPSFGGLTGAQLADLGVPGTSGGLFGGTTLTGALGGIGAGVGAGGLISSLFGGNSTIGSAGGAVGGLVGNLLLPGIGGILGGALGGLTGLFGNNTPSNNPAGADINLITGQSAITATSPDAASNQNVQQIAKSLQDFTKQITQLTGKPLSLGNTTVDIQSGVRDGIKLGFGGSTRAFGDAASAINAIELEIAHNLTGLSDSLTTVLSKITDPAQVQDAVTFALQYDNLKKAADSAFSSIQTDTQQIGPFAAAMETLGSTFADMANKANQFGLSLDPINKGLDEATRRLRQDFKTSLDQAFDSASSKEYLNTLRGIGEAFRSNTREASAIGLEGDTSVTAKIAQLEIAKAREALSTLTSEQLNEAYSALRETNPEIAELAKSMIEAGTAATDATQSITSLADGLKSLQDLGTSLTTGKLSGLTDAAATTAAIKQYSKDLDVAKAAGTAITGTQVAALATSADAAINASLAAYGNAPATADLRRKVVDDINVIEDVAKKAQTTQAGVANVPASVGAEQAKVRAQVLAGVTTVATPTAVATPAPAAAAAPSTPAAATPTASTPDTSGAHTVGNIYYLTADEQGAYVDLTKIGGAATGSMSTPPGKLLVGEKGPEWMLPAAAYSGGTISSYGVGTFISRYMMGISGDNTSSNSSMWDWSKHYKNSYADGATSYNMGTVAAYDGGTVANWDWSKHYKNSYMSGTSSMPSYAMGTNYSSSNNINSMPSYSTGTVLFAGGSNTRISSQTAMGGTGPTSYMGGTNIAPTYSSGTSSTISYYSGGTISNVSNDNTMNTYKGGTNTSTGMWDWSRHYKNSYSDGSSNIASYSGGTNRSTFIYNRGSTSNTYASYAGGTLGSSMVPVYAVGTGDASSTHIDNSYCVGTDNKSSYAGGTVKNWDWSKHYKNSYMSGTAETSGGANLSMMMPTYAMGSSTSSHIHSSSNNMSNNHVANYARGTNNTNTITSYAGGTLGSSMVPVYGAGSIDVTRNDNAYAYGTIDNTSIASYIGGTISSPSRTTNVSNSHASYMNGTASYATAYTAAYNRASNPSYAAGTMNNTYAFGSYADGTHISNSNSYCGGTSSNTMNRYEGGTVGFISSMNMSNSNSMNKYEGGTSANRYEGGTVNAAYVGGTRVSNINNMPSYMSGTSSVASYSTGVSMMMPTYSGGSSSVVVSNDNKRSYESGTVVNTSAAYSTGAASNQNLSNIIASYVFGTASNATINNHTPSYYSGTRVSNLQQYKGGTFVGYNMGTREPVVGVSGMYDEGGGTVPGKILVGEKGPEWMLPKHAGHGWDKSGWVQVGKTGPEIIDQKGGAVILPFPVHPRDVMPREMQREVPGYAEGTDIVTVPVEKGFVAGDTNVTNTYNTGSGSGGDLVAEMRAVYQENIAMRNELSAIKRQIQGGQIQATNDANAGNSRLASIDSKIGSAAVTPARRAVG